MQLMWQGPLPHGIYAPQLLRVCFWHELFSETAIAPRVLEQKQREG